MAAELAIVIKASALVGAASAAITGLGGSMAGLERASGAVTRAQTRLSQQIKSGVGSSRTSVEQLQQRYNSLGTTLDKLSQKQSKLQTLTARQSVLKENASQLRGDAVGAAGAFMGVVGPMRAAISASSEYRVEMTRIGNTSELSREQSKLLGDDLLEQSVKFGVAADKLRGGLGEMVAGGIDPTVAINSVGSMANVIKAYNADAIEVGATNNALITNMGYTAQGLKRPWDILATSAAQGNFELKDMAKWLPTLGASVKALGSVGDEGTAVSGAFLQIAKRGAGSADEAANNYQNFLQKLSQGGTEKNAKGMGFSIRDTMLKAKKEGLDPVEAAVLKIKDITGGDQFKIAELFPDMQAQNFLRPAIQNWADYKKIKDDSLKGDGKIDQDAQKIAQESAAISEKAGAAWLNFKVKIGDALTPVWNKGMVAFTSFITVLTAGITEFPQLTTAVLGLLGAFAGFKMGSFAVRAAMLLMNMGLVGGRLNILKLSSALTQGSAAWQVMRSAQLVGGRALIRHNNIIGSTVRGLAHASRWYRNTNQSMLDWISNGGRRAKIFLTSLPTQVGKAALALKGLHLPRFKLGGKLGGFKFAMPSFSLQSFARVLPRIQSGLQAIAIGMRALAFNPLGLLIAAIVVGAVLIYKYWNPIKAFFGGLWDGLKAGMAPLAPMFDALANAFSAIWAKVAPFVQPIIDWFKDFFTVTQVGEGGARSFGESIGLWIGEKISAVVGWIGSKITEIKTAFNGGLTGILGLIINWSPLGAFYSAFAGVMSWFGIELPAKFTGFGSMIVQGLANGIRAGASSVYNAISEMGSSAIAKAKGIFGIRSPSRVFMGIGGFVTQGLDVGLTRGGLRPLATIGSLANNLQQRFKNRAGELRSNLTARMQANSAEMAAARAQQQSAQAAQYGGNTFHYSPQIHAPGGDINQIAELLKMSRRDFERRMEQYIADKARRSYA